MQNCATRRWAIYNCSHDYWVGFYTTLDKAKEGAITYCEDFLNDDADFVGDIRLQFFQIDVEKDKPVLTVIPRIKGIKLKEI